MQQRRQHTLWGVFAGLALGIGLAVGGCSAPGFQTNPAGLSYLLVEEHPNAEKPQIGDVLDLSVRYHIGDSVLLDTRLYLSLDSPRHPGGSIETGLAMLHIGDSALFRLSAHDFYRYSLRRPYPIHFDQEATLQFEVRLHGFKDRASIERERQAMRHRNKMDEETEIAQFLERQQWGPENTNGLYVRTLQPGSGATIETGQTLTVHYVGSFLSGQVFDSSYARKQPFAFRYGTGEVIAAWDIGLKAARVGDKLQVICPSWYAYADEGVEGLIPPGTPLFFEIEILSAQ